MFHKRATSDREKLEQSTLEELREEASTYGLSSVGDRANLIDRIMSHLERHGPTDLQQENSDEAATPASIDHSIEVATPLTAEIFLQTMLQMQQQIGRGNS